MFASLAPSSVKYAVHNLGQCVISFNIAKKSPSLDVRMNMIPEHAGVWSLQSFQCRKWGNIENSSSYHKNIKTLHLQRKRKLEVNFLSLLASLEHDIERLSDWVSVPRGCAMLLRTAPNLFTFQAFAIQLVCWCHCNSIIISITYYILSVILET